METFQIVSLIARNVIEVLNTDESSSDSDDENMINVLNICRIRGHQELRPRVEDYVSNVVSLYTDVEFKSHFRMRRETFHFLLNMISPYLAKKVNVDINNQGPGRQPIDPAQQLLIAIWTMATPDSYRSVCDRFNIGRATAIRTVRRVTKALLHLLPRFIKWPSEEEAIRIHVAFEMQQGVPNVLGAIDGTHIKIAAPKANPEAYINRKGFHSIQLQVVCDNDLKFLHCFVGHPGSVHDQRVFRLSGMLDICSDHGKFPNDSHLIGDAAYAIQRHEIVPYKDNGHLTARQKNFNFCLSSTRMVVERSLALLKRRFRSMLDKLPMTRTDLIPDYIMACCVLHNVCIIRNDFVEIPIIGHQLDNDVARDNVDPGLRLDGVQKRVRITNALDIRV